MIYSVERNYATDYIITMYYFYELEYWIKSLRVKLNRNKCKFMGFLVKKITPNMCFGNVV